MQYYISHTVNVFEDSFSEGEGKHVNSWRGSRKIEADSPIDALKKYYANELFEEFNHENVLIDGVDIWDSFTKNRHDENPSEKELESWKNGEIELYSYNTHIVVQLLTPIEVRL